MLPLEKPGWSRDGEKGTLAPCLPGISVCMCGFCLALGHGGGPTHHFEEQPQAQLLTSGEGVPLSLDQEHIG